MQGQGGPQRNSGWSLVAVGVVLVAIGLLAVNGAQGATSRQLLQATPTPEYQLPTPTPTATATVTPTPTPFHEEPVPKPTGPSLMKPFPTVRTAGNYNRKRTLLTLVRVSGPSGAKVEGRCTRLARKCHTDATLPAKQTLRLKRLQRKYKPRSTIRVRVMSPIAYGKYVVIKIRKGKPPVRRDRCLKPGTRRAVACPSS